MKLHTYFRSSASFRVRIALNLKGLVYDSLPVHLARDGGQQNSERFRALNPEGLVPVLEEDGQVLTQSLAIMEYLEEEYPNPPLLPEGSLARARVRSISQAVACDIHPLNNLRVLRYLTGVLAASEDQKNTWYRHWVNQGLTGLEVRLARETATGKFCHGDNPTFADCCLVPQIFNAQRFDCDLAPFPTVMRIYQACMALDAFKKAAPGEQPDAE